MSSDAITQFLIMASKKGSLVQNIRLNKNIRADIEFCITTESDQTNRLSEIEFESLMIAFNWLQNRLDRSVVLLKKMNKDIANELLAFCERNKQEFPLAMQWIINQVNKQYSLFDLCA